MKSMSLDRRALLRGAAGIGIALPWLEAMTAGVARAAAAAPRRLVTVFTPIGHEPSGWPTSANLTGTSLEPLAPFASDVVVTRGMDMTSTYKFPGADNSHYLGWAHALTATAALLDGGHASGGGISYDMDVAKRIGADTRFLYSLHGVYAEGPTSWLDRGVGAPPVNDPAKVFDRLFSSLAAPPDTLARLRARRRSVLDYVAGSLARTSCRLGVEDRRRLDAHLFSIRDIEMRLDAAGAAGVQCKAPARPTVALNPAAPDPGPVGRLHMDLMVMALACDLTRVAGLQYFRAVVGGRPTWIGIADDHHELSHMSTPDARDKVRRINKWYAGELAYLLGKLKGTVQPDGSTLLASTVVCTTSELGLTGHERKNLSIVVAGQGGGRIKTGQYLDLAGLPHNNLFLELINALLPAGQPPVTAFGEKTLCTGGIPALRA
jgi:hypothetical protein